MKLSPIQRQRIERFQRVQAKRARIIAAVEQRENSTVAEFNLPKFFRKIFAIFF